MLKLIERPSLGEENVEVAPHEGQFRCAPHQSDPASRPSLVKRMTEIRPEHPEPRTTLYAGCTLLFLTSMSLYACGGDGGLTAEARAVRVPQRDYTDNELEPSKDSGGISIPQEVRTWRASMRNLRLPHIGCFTAAFPETKWSEIECVQVSSGPYGFAEGRAGSSSGVGNASDYAAQVSAQGSLTLVEGSFPVVAGAASETDMNPQFGCPTVGSDSFSFQINANTFQNSKTRSLCAGAQNPNDCLGWQQFIYKNSPSSSGVTTIFIQYQLLHYNETCPPSGCTCPSGGWTPYPDGLGGNHCYINSSGPGRNMEAVSPVNAMSGTLGGAADTGSGGDVDQDTVFYFSTPNYTYTAGSQASFLGLRGNWSAAEFNVFGYVCDSEAQFSTPTTLQVNVATFAGDYPDTKVPLPAACVANAGTTGETSNLNFVGACCPSPSGITFTESNAAAGAAAPFCLPLTDAIGL